LPQCPIAGDATDSVTAYDRSYAILRKKLNIHSFHKLGIVLVIIL